jgi:hypothetical protein
VLHADATPFFVNYRDTLRQTVMQEIVQPLCRDIETDLRLHIHTKHLGTSRLVFALSLYAACSIVHSEDAHVENVVTSFLDLLTSKMRMFCCGLFILFSKIYIYLCKCVASIQLLMYSYGALTPLHPYFGTDHMQALNPKTENLKPLRPFLDLAPLRILGLLLDVKAEVSARYLLSYFCCVYFFICVATAHRVDFTSAIPTPSRCDYVFFSPLCTELALYSTILCTALGST